MESNLITRLSPPQWTLHRQIMALFNRDPEITIKDLIETKEGYSILMLINNKEKAKALKTLLKNSYNFGGIVVIVYVFGPDENPATTPANTDDIQTVSKAFTGNPIFNKVETVSYCIFGNIITRTYCVFKKEVIQFWNDDISDLYGNCSTLPHLVADDLLNDTSVSFCTGIE